MGIVYSEDENFLKTLWMQQLYPLIWSRNWLSPPQMRKRRENSRGEPTCLTLYGCAIGSRKQTARSDLCSASLLSKTTMHSKQRESNVVPIEAADGKGTCFSGRDQTLAAKELCNRR